MYHPGYGVKATICLCCYNCRHAHEIGIGKGEDFTINVPLPPGSGSGAYRAAFDRVVVPALDAFRPQVQMDVGSLIHT